MGNHVSLGQIHGNLKLDLKEIRLYETIYKYLCKLRKYMIKHHKAKWKTNIRPTYVSTIICFSYIKKYLFEPDLFRFCPRPL